MTSYMPCTDCAAFDMNENGQLRCEYLTEMFCVTRGKCKFYNPVYPKMYRKPRRRNGAKKRSFTDREAFALWQKGKTDAQAAEILGVSRQMIQRWRDIMELPSTAKNDVDTKKYRLAHLQDGTTICIKTD